MLCRKFRNPRKIWRVELISCQKKLKVNRVRKVIILIEATLTEEVVVDIITEVLEEVSVVEDFEEDVDLSTKTTALSLLRIMRLLNIRQ